MTAKSLTLQKLTLIERAREQYGDIAFCGKAQTWHECFTEEFGNLYFWFNVGKDTRMLKEVQP